MQLDQVACAPSRSSGGGNVSEALPRDVHGNICVDLLIWHLDISGHAAFAFDNSDYLKIVASHAEGPADGVFRRQELARTEFCEDNNTGEMVYVGCGEDSAGDDVPFEKLEPCRGRADYAEFEASLTEAALLANQFDGNGLLYLVESLLDSHLVIIRQAVNTQVRTHRRGGCFLHRLNGIDNDVVNKSTLLDKDMDKVLTYVLIFCIIIIGKTKWTLS